MVGALALAGSAAACVHRAPPPSLRPALTGNWVLVADSGHARPTALTATTSDLPDRGDESSGAARGGRGGERGERGEGGYNRARSYDPEAVQVALAALARGEGRVHIVQTDTSVHLDFADASYFDLATNGHGGDDVWRNVGRIKSMARWTDAGLLFQRKLDNGVTVNQTYTRPAGSPRLVVETVVTGPVPRPITQRRVYEVAAAPRAGR